MTMFGRIAAIAAISLLTGCGVSAVPPDNGDGGASAPVPAGNGTPANPTAPEPAGLPSAGGAEPAEQRTEPEEPAPAPAPVAVEQDYYMDANFILRPKLESGDKRVVLLTFDDGPKDKATLAAMLDALDRHKAKAIFFVNGYRAKRQPELLKLMRDRGHHIGNHAWDHVDLKKQPQEEMERQIDDVQSFVEEATGEAPAFFRPPFGSGGEAVRAKAKEADLLYMTWSNGSRDWEQGYDDPQKVIESVLEQLHPGSNILMHELPWTAEALDGLLNALKDKGYSVLDPARIDPDYSNI